MIGKIQFHADESEQRRMAKIMIVDDDKQVTDLLQRLLVIEGYETVAINDSARAVETARIENPDLFLLDLMMPPPDGFKLCRMLRQDPGFHFTPIVIVTALDDTDSRVVAFGAGANDYITKPFMPDELLQRVKEMLE
jgi:DNA-binding response OmpR family regulator